MTKHPQVRLTARHARTCWCCRSWRSNALHGYAIAQRPEAHVARRRAGHAEARLYPTPCTDCENRGSLGADWKPSDTGREAKFLQADPRRAAPHLEAEIGQLGAADRRDRGDPEHGERRGVMTWWRRAFSRDRLESQLDAELRDHFDRLVARFRRARVTAESEARRLARLEFGGLDQVKEACRDERGTSVDRRNAAGRALRAARLPRRIRDSRSSRSSRSRSVSAPVSRLFNIVRRAVVTALLPVPHASGVDHVLAVDWQQREP